MIISEVLSINEKMTNQNNSHHMISNHMAAAYCSLSNQVKDYILCITVHVFWGL